ncbi:LytTR family DNA-binding domain-containing protein [Qipengyuania sp. ASV99]|uniref:LytTR family DNA-binding domain-containing protein n=1 Tax=Qipengyuania sp. ASV99 TaxID=3399681 RepID=UPI003A4C807B
MNSGASERAIGKRALFLRKLFTDLAIMTAIGVFLAIIGPFGSIAEPLPLRLITWLAFSYLGYAIYSPMGYLVERGHTALDLPKLPLWVAATMAATVPMTVVIFFIQFMPNWPPVPSLEEALTSYFYVFIIGGGVTLLFNVIGQNGSADPAIIVANSRHPEAGAAAGAVATPKSGHPWADAVAPAPPPAPATNPLIDQLPPELGSDVIALEMEDHYVRVHTALGSDLVLMRLRDAMAHMAAHCPETDGRQVHRSWWVARLAVEDVKREGRNIRLVLAGGITAPVSRAQVSELKAAGWI